jgi:exonuclease III
VSPKDIKRKNTEILAITQNLRSTRKNGHKLKELIVEGDISLIMTQETWGHALTIKGYNNHSLHRTGKRGGGVSTIYNKELNLTLLEKNIDENIEYIISTNKTLTIINVYRPPSGSIQTFLSTLKQITNNVKSNNKTTIVTGDFNIDMASSSW